MSPVRNALEFVQKFRAIRARYDEVHRPNVDMTRRAFDENPRGISRSDVDESLEAHLRVYVINAFLEALNWRMGLSADDGLPNLIPEAGVFSQETLHRRFLDYVGKEIGTARPLLIVETKRPSATLPQYAEGRDSDDSINITISEGLKGTELSGDWDEWLETLRDYVVSVKAATHICPKRVAVTNGLWLVIFRDPEDAFLDGGTQNSAKISVFKELPNKASEIETLYDQVFEALEYGRVSGGIGAIHPAQLQFLMTSEDAIRVLHGVRVLYSNSLVLHRRRAPSIRVSPMVFVGTRSGQYFKVETRESDHTVPHEEDELVEHLNEVNEDAAGLLAQVNENLQSNLAPIPLAEHYRNPEAFEKLPGVSMEGQEYLLVTGRNTHYVLSQATVENCRFHDWNACNAEYVATEHAAITRRSTDHFSFFKSGEEQHCAHVQVFTIKSEPVGPHNQNRCGPRSGKPLDPFCEIYGFERQLCCRTCAFEEVCSGAQVFRLPCRR